MPYKKQHFPMRLVLYGIVISVMANIGALIDLFKHPEIGYFDPEHVWVGTANVLVLAVVFCFLEFFLQKVRVADEVRAREEVKRDEAERFLCNIFQSINKGLVVVDREYKIISANEYHEQSMKLEKGEAIGRHCYEVSHQLNDPCYKHGEECAVRKVFQTGKPQKVIHEHTAADGSKRYIELSAYPMLDANGKVISVIEVMDDVTREKRLEEQLRQAQKMEAVGHLAGGVAHNFNNILTAIIGYGNIMKMKMSPNDPLHAYIENILSAGEKASSLTSSLLAFSRKRAINPKRVDPNDIIRSVQPLVTMMVGEDIEISVQLSKRSMHIMADAGQLEEVIMNLVVNARDAMLTRGSIVIQAEYFYVDERFRKKHGYGKFGHYAMIAVSDTGHGMSHEVVEHIFEPFFTTKEVGRGTGIGLAMVYGTVKQHGGMINVYSEVDEGTVFKLYFPLVGSENGENVSEVKRVEKCGTETVLLAEDEPQVREVQSATLQSLGYSVIEAVDGAEAIEKYIAHRDRISLVILDVIMPKKNGKEVWGEIFGINPKAKVLFLSGYDAGILERKGITGEDVPFLSKPVSPVDLSWKIREILDGE